LTRFSAKAASAARYENDLSVFARKSILINFINELQSKRDAPDAVTKFTTSSPTSIYREVFSAKNMQLPMPRRDIIECSFDEKIVARRSIELRACAITHARKGDRGLSGFAEANVPAYLMTSWKRSQRSKKIARRPRQRAGKADAI